MVGDSSTDTMEISTPSQVKPRGLKKIFARRKKSIRVVQGSPPITGCCFPSLRRKSVSRMTIVRNDVKQVRFNAQPSGVSCMVTPKVLRKKSNLSGRGLKVKQAPADSCHSRRSYYSAVSTLSRMEKCDGDDNNDGDVDEQDTTTTAGTDSEEGRDRHVEFLDVTPDVVSKDVGVVACVCQAPAHSNYDSMIPLMVGPGVEPSSFEELLIHAKSVLGCWVTILDRSQSLDPQMVYLGIGKLKRSIMNKLAIPLTAVLVENETVLDAWIGTPIGNKHTRASLVGKETEDRDGDLGDWTASTSIVDYSIPWFCNGKSVRAMQLTRNNPKLGVAYETRIVLPDSAEGKILLYNITMHPPDKPIISVDRLFRFTGPN